MSPHPGSGTWAHREQPPAALGGSCRQSRAMLSLHEQQNRSRVLGTGAQEVQPLRPGPCCLHGCLGFAFGLFCCFPGAGLLAALRGPRQLREVDMFTSKELLLIKHQ